MATAPGHPAVSGAQGASPEHAPSARAMEDAQREATDVRENMARLRELRLAKEAAAGNEPKTQQK